VQAYQVTVRTLVPKRLGITLPQNQKVLKIFKKVLKITKNILIMKAHLTRNHKLEVYTRLIIQLEVYTRLIIQREVVHLETCRITPGRRIQQVIK